jgi:hypothetical protein
MKQKGDPRMSRVGYWDVWSISTKRKGRSDINMLRYGISEGLELEMRRARSELKLVIPSA